MKRFATLAVLTLAVLMSLVAVAVAQDEEFLEGKIRSGDSITIPAGETVEGDLYLFGGNVTIAGTVTGDLLVFGGQVDISGTVEGDLFVGAGTTDITGTVMGDVRAGTGQLRIPGMVGEDVLAGTGQLTVSGDVGEDVLFGAGTMSLSGSVGGDVLGQTGAYDRTGTVGGSEDVTIQESEPVERVGPFVRGLSRFASLLIIGLGVIWLLRKTFEGRIADLRQSPGSVALWGLLFLAALVIVPLAVTLVGVLLAIVFGLLGLGLLVGITIMMIVVTWVLVGLVAFIVIAVLAPITVGTWLAAMVLPDDTPAYLAMAAGVAALVILELIPIVGGLVGLAVTIIGGGVWLRMLRRSRDSVEPVLTG